MKINNISRICAVCSLLAGLLSSCEKKLEEVSYSSYTSSSFFTNATDANSAVTAMYSGMLGSGYYGGGWGAANEGWVAQSSFETDELVCSWGWDGWAKFNQLNFSEDFSELLNHYFALMPKITEITTDIDKIQKIDMDDAKKAYDIAQLKALRAHYTWMLYNFYGPVPIVTDPAAAADPNAAPEARPTSQWMVSQIEKDYNDAMPNLLTCQSLPPSDYGRFTQDACLMGLMKLYMHEKRWSDVISTGHKLQAYGHGLQTNYADIFSYANKGNSKEVILAISCRIDANNTNLWLAMSMPGNYVDPGGLTITQWGGYKMPWTTYNKFDQNDARLSMLLKKWPTYNGATFDALANSYIGAIPMKYGPDPNAISEQQGTDIVVWRYADVLLMMAEAINESQGPVAEAYDYIDSVRNRAHVPPYTVGQFTTDQFREKIKDERLFELWCEGSRREDMIRWGDYISRAKSAGSVFAKDDFVLYPLPRKVISETKGVVVQNNGY
jgi:hypothetical protein